MIIDVHTHIFPKAVCDFRGDYFDNEDAFRLLYDSPKSRLIGADSLIESMDIHGVDRSVAFGFPWKNPEFYKKNNDSVLASVQKYPGRLIGLCCVDVFSEGAVAEVERCLDAGLSGVGELAFYESGIETGALQRLAPIMDLCREKGVPVMIHTNEPVGHAYPGKTPNTLAQIYAMAKMFPDNKIILAHWGGGIFFYTLLKKEVRDVLKNIYFDTAASPFLYSPEIYPAAIRMAGAEKILMGTDFPLLPPDRYFREIDAAGISPLERERICGLNAAGLFV
ncbi:MAG: amidohydrolase [Desulfobacteraceae bacterium]|nr:MAG: amidohydrolase [Desulfobacteraceae bacterium]